MKTIIVNRDFGNKDQSLGVCYVIEDGKLLFKSESIERGWRDNESRVSCVPSGAYECVLEYSPRFDKELWELKDVPNRSECKFHAANYARQLNGCIALGKARVDLDGDGQIDIASSRQAMKEFHKAMGDDKKAIVVISNIVDHDE